MLRAAFILSGFKYVALKFVGLRDKIEYKVFTLPGRLNYYRSVAQNVLKRSVDFMVTPEYSKDRVHIKGNFMVKLSDFKLKRPTLLMIPTADDLKIDIDVAAEGP